jgi:hypothetical protein
MSNYSRKEKGFRSTKSPRSNVNYENFHRRKPTSDDSENLIETNSIIKYDTVIRADRSYTFQNEKITNTEDHHPTTTLEQRNNLRKLIRSIQ